MHTSSSVGSVKSRIYLTGDILKPLSFLLGESAVLCLSGENLSTGNFDLYGDDSKSVCVFCKNGDSEAFESRLCELEA